MEKETLGDVVRTRRIALGWTQEELADQVTDLGDPIRQSDISRLERNETSLPRRARLEHIAEALDLPLGELLERSGWSGASSVFEDEDHAEIDASRSGPPGSDLRSEPYAVANFTGAHDTADGYRRLQRALSEAYDHQQRLTYNRQKTIESQRRFAELVRRRVC